MKNVAREATNGVIYGESGEIVKNGLRVVCPHCGEIGLYPGHGGSVNIWTWGQSSGGNVRNAVSSSTQSV